MRLQQVIHRFAPSLAAPGLAVLVAFPACADPAVEAAQPASYLSQLIGGLALVILMIFVLAWLLRRLPGATGQSGQLIDVLAVKPLGMRERLMLVRVGEEQILLAMTPAGIRHIHTLSQPLDLPQNTQPRVDFASLLRRADGREAGR